MEDVDTNQAGGSDTDRIAIPPGLIEKWQSIADTIAELAEVPAGLIMRATGGTIEVLVASRSAGNPYRPGDTEHLTDSGLYCETVIRSGRKLLVPDALADAAWRNNPDVRLNMISYLGFPILWPDGMPFGTICLLDGKANSYDELHERLLRQFRDLIEHHLQLIYTDTTRQQARLFDRRRQEQALLDAQAALEQAARRAMLGEMAGIIVQQINQPLHSIAASAEATLRWLDRDRPDIGEVRAAAALIARAERRAAEIVAGLHALVVPARPDGRLVDLNAVARRLPALMQPELERQGIAMEEQLGDGPLLAVGDRESLEQVLRNLILNGIEAMATTDGPDRRLILRSGRDEGGDPWIAIEDHGIGLAGVPLDRIFEPLFTTKAQGLGLGLAVCRSILQAHGRDISASSRPDGPGACFSFSLPRAPAF